VCEFYNGVSRNGGGSRPQETSSCLNVLCVLLDVNEVKSVDLAGKKKKEKNLEAIIFSNWHKSGISWKSAAQIFSYYQPSWGLNEAERALPVYRS